MSTGPPTSDQPLGLQYNFGSFSRTIASNEVQHPESPIASMGSIGSRKGRELGHMISSSTSLPSTTMSAPSRPYYAPHYGKDRPSHPADLQPAPVPAFSETPERPQHHTSSTLSSSFLIAELAITARSEDPVDHHIVDGYSPSIATPSATRPTRSHSKPIPIPIPSANSGNKYTSHRLDPDTPTTPLTGRFEPRGTHFPSPSHFKYSSSSSDKGDSPNSKGSPCHQGHSQLTSLPSAMVTDRPSRLYTPTSPLSPTMNSSQHPQNSQQPRQPHSPTQQRTMRLGNLPRYHPQAYQSPNRSQNNSQPSLHPPSPLGNSSSYFRSSSDSQKALRQYQRDLIANAKVSSTSVAAPGVTKPSAPRLDPLGSPGPVTPLALEEEGGYLTAGLNSISNNGSPVLSGDEENAADLVDKYIRKENKRWEMKSRGNRDSRGSPVLLATNSN